MMANPADMQKYLAGIDYPMDKEGIIEHAKRNDAPEDIVMALEFLEDREYANPADVSSELEGNESLLL